MSRRMSRLRTLLLIPLVLVVCAILGGIYGPKVAATPSDDADTEIQNDLRAFSRVYSLVERNYAVPVDADRAIYKGAIPGMLRELDPHSSFFDPKEYARMREDQRGRYFGVGMRIGLQGDRTVVVMPFEGTPAFRAGLRPGDIIYAVDGKSAEGLTSDQIALMLKGPKGTTVHIAVTRAGHKQPVEFTVVRDDVHVNSIDEAYQITPGVLYIHLQQFTETSHHELQQAIDQAGGANRLKGLVLDLRGDPGGLLSQAVDIADMLLSKGQVIVSHRGRSSPERVYTALHGNSNHDYPLVILVDGSTASAAEIVSGAVQDHDRGLIAGQTTFGKGLVQSVYPLSDNTGLALTFAHYYTPSGRLIQRNYEGVSLYDYYYAHADISKDRNREVKMTDSGRTVYGGGGITPDIVLPEQKQNEFQDTVYSPDRNVILAFANDYLGKHDNVPRDWNPDQNTIEEFRQYLISQNIPFSDADITANETWIKQQVKRQIFTSLYGLSEGLKIVDRDDPEIKRAVELLPQAQALNQHAKEILAARQNAAARSFQQ